jgi:hypothetical protein
METDTLGLYYFRFFSNFTNIKEIDHIVPELFENLKMLIPPYVEGSDLYTMGDEEELGVFLIDQSLGICYTIFDILYPMCRDIIFELKAKPVLEKNELQSLLQATRILIIMNGEVNTVFTQRKRLLDAGIIEDLNEELSFLRTVCLKFKKSSICWEYRRKVITRYLESNCKNEGTLLSFFSTEREFLQNYVKTHPRNYYCWSHRLSIFKLLLEYLKTEAKTELLKKEISEVRNFCEKNTREYSAFHYLQILIGETDPKELHSVIDLELSWIESLIITYADLYSSDNGDQNPYVDVPYSNLEALKKHKNVLKLMLDAPRKKD